MTKNQKAMRSMEEKWDDYREAVLGREQENMDMALAELLFYGGATAAMAVVGELFNDDISAEDAAKGLEALFREIMFHEFEKVSISAVLPGA